MAQDSEETTLRLIYNQLVADKKVTSQNDFAAQTKYHPTPLSMMLRGEKPLPFKFLQALYKIYNVNINFIISKGAGSMFLGQGEMVSKKDIEAMNTAKEKLKALEKEIIDLKQRLADKEEIIHLLKKTSS